MNSRLIIALVISGIAVALIGVGLDYQRRVKNREEYQAWKQADAVRRAELQRRSDADFAKIQDDLKSWSKAAAESAQKFAQDTAKQQDAAREQAAAQNLREMKRDAEARLKAAQEEGYKASGF